jgi:hypothetical protein
MLQGGENSGLVFLFCFVLQDRGRVYKIYPVEELICEDADVQ